MIYVLTALHSQMCIRDMRERLLINEKLFSLLKAHQQEFQRQEATDFKHIVEVFSFVFVEKPGLWSFVAVEIFMKQVEHVERKLFSS